MRHETRTATDPNARKGGGEQGPAYYIRTARGSRQVVEIQGEPPKSPDASGSVTRYSGPYASEAEASATLARMTARK